MQFFLPLILLTSCIFSTLEATSYEEGTVSISGKSVHFKSKPKHSKVTHIHYRPRIPVLVPILMNQDNHYYTTVQNNCNKFIDIINEKDAEILKLTKKINRLEEKEAERTRKELKKKYDDEMKKFENRKSSISTKNSILISE